LSISSCLSIVTCTESPVAQGLTRSYVCCCPRIGFKRERERERTWHWIDRRFTTPYAPTTHPSERCYLSIAIHLSPCITYICMYTSVRYNKS
jgi:hypothetical protein